MDAPSFLLLGGLQVVTTTDLNTINKTSICGFNQNVSHTPFTYGMCVTFMQGTYGYQLAFNVSSGQHYAIRRTLTSDWEYLTHLDYLNSYSTLSDLASALGVWKNFGRLNSGNANTILSNNLYFAEMNGAGMSNLPTNNVFYHVLTMPGTENPYATQLAITMNGGAAKTYVRNRDTSGWTSWIEL